MRPCHSEDKAQCSPHPLAHSDLEDARKFESLSIHLLERKVVTNQQENYLHWESKRNLRTLKVCPWRPRGAPWCAWHCYHGSFTLPIPIWKSRQRESWAPTWLWHFPATWGPLLNLLLFQLVKKIKLAVRTLGDQPEKNTLHRVPRNTRSSYLLTPFPFGCSWDRRPDCLGLKPDLAACTRVILGKWQSPQNSPYKWEAVCSVVLTPRVTLRVALTISGTGWTYVWNTGCAPETVDFYYYFIVNVIVL